MWILLIVLVSGDGITKVEVPFNNAVACSKEAVSNTYHTPSNRSYGYTSYGRCIYKAY